MRLTKKNKLFLLFSLGTGLALLSCKKEEGLIKSDQIEKWTYFSTDNGLPSNQINCLAEDSSHNVWIGTNKGLVKYDGSKFTCLTTKNGLPSDSVYSLFCYNKSNLLIGTQNGFGEINISNSYSNILNLAGLKCVSFCADPTSTAIYCSTNCGVVIYDYSVKEWAYVEIDSTEINGISLPDSVYDVIIDKQNNIWVAAQKGIYIYTTSKRVINYNKKLGLTVSKLFVDKDENVWISPSDGSGILYFNGTNYIYDPLFLGYNNYKAIIQDQYNNYWISIANKGVLNYGGGMTKVYNTTNSKIISNDVNTLLYDSKKSLWFGSNDNGLMHYENIKPLQFEYGVNSNSNPCDKTIY